MCVKPTIVLKIVVTFLRDLWEDDLMLNGTSDITSDGFNHFMVKKIGNCGRIIRAIQPRDDSLLALPWINFGQFFKDGAHQISVYRHFRASCAG